MDRISKSQYNRGLPFEEEPFVQRRRTRDADDKRRAMIPQYGGVDDASKATFSALLRRKDLYKAMFTGLKKMTPQMKRLGELLSDETYDDKTRKATLTAFFYKYPELTSVVKKKVLQLPDLPHQ